MVFKLFGDKHYTKGRRSPLQHLELHHRLEPSKQSDVIGSPPSHLPVSKTCIVTDGLSASEFVAQSSTNPAPAVSTDCLSEGIPNYRTLAQRHHLLVFLAEIRLILQGCSTNHEALKLLFATTFWSSRPKCQEWLPTKLQEAIAQLDAWSWLELTIRMSLHCSIFERESDSSIYPLTMTHSLCRYPISINVRWSWTV